MRRFFTPLLAITAFSLPVTNMFARAAEITSNVQALVITEGGASTNSTTTLNFSSMDKCRQIAKIETSHRFGTDDNHMIIDCIDGEGGIVERFEGGKVKALTFP